MYHAFSACSCQARECTIVSRNKHSLRMTNFSLRGPNDWDPQGYNDEEENTEDLNALGMKATDATGAALSDDEDEDEEEEDDNVEKLVDEEENKEAPTAETFEDDDKAEEVVDELKELDRLAKELEQEDMGLDDGEDE